MNSSLSEEQRRRIDENRKKALEKRAAAIKAKSDSSEARRLIPSAASTSHNESAKNNVVSCSITPNRPVSTAVCRMSSIRHRFTVDMSYNAPAIALFKTVKGYKYEPTTKRWSFPRSAYNKVIEHLKSLKPEVNIYPLPEPGDITKILLNAGTKTWNRDVDLSSIDPFLVQALRVFQREGVCFGVSRGGRVLIADDMGLGKTIQALGIAHFYYNDWPLLIVSTSSMRYTWQESIWSWLPSVPPNKVMVFKGKQDEGSLQDVKVLILSYGLLHRRVNEPEIQNCKVIIIDESHYIKNVKTALAKAALPLIKSAKRAILLSGTPALSRPIELYTQLTAISPEYRKMFPRNYVKELVERGRKFLCFAHHKCVLDGVSEALEDINCSYIRIDGSTPSKDRKRLVDEFQQNESCFVAVLSITASAGITLTAASLVVFAELYWNPGNLIQAEDRAHRIGQEDRVLVQYLVANETVDVGIWKLVSDKSTILNKIGLLNDSFEEVDEFALSHHQSFQNQHPYSGLHEPRSKPRSSERQTGLQEFSCPSDDHIIRNEDDKDKAVVDRTSHEKIEIGLEMEGDDSLLEGINMEYFMEKSETDSNSVHPTQTEMPSGLFFQDEKVDLECEKNACLRKTNTSTFSAQLSSDSNLSRLELELNRKQQHREVDSSTIPSKKFKHMLKY